MSEDARPFWQQVVRLAVEVVTCKECQVQQNERQIDFVAKQNALKSAGKEYKELQDLGLPQPGWVGPHYLPGKGLVFILQNPGIGGIGHGWETQYQHKLRALAENPTPKTYEEYVAQTLSVVPSWFMYKRFIHDVVEECADIRSIAWLNAVKFRTPDNAHLREKEKKHSLEGHLKKEIALLKPAAIVTIGEPAREVVARLADTIPIKPSHEHLMMRGTDSSKAHARDIGKHLHSLGF